MFQATVKLSLFSEKILFLPTAGYWVWKSWNVNSYFWLDWAHSTNAACLHTSNENSRSFTALIIILMTLKVWVQRYVSVGECQHIFCLFFICQKHWHRFKSLTLAQLLFSLVKEQETQAAWVKQHSVNMIICWAQSISFVVFVCDYSLPLYGV